MAAARTVHDQTVQLSHLDETKPDVPSNGPQDDLMSPTRLPFPRLRTTRDETTRDPVDRQVFKLKEMDGFGSFWQQVMTGEPKYDLQYVGYTFDDQPLGLVVSFLGDSTSGKSYLLSKLLETFEISQNWG